MKRTRTVDKFLTKFDKELKSGLISLILLFMIERAQKSMYGYHLIREIREKSGGNLDFKEGTIYPILRNLEARGLLKSAWDTTEKRPRKYYAITPDGRSALTHGIGEWQSFSGLINDFIEDSVSRKNGAAAGAIAGEDETASAGEKGGRK